MNTISLDEAGLFESYIEPNEKDSKTTLIGGFIYDDNGYEGDADAEKKRIVAYYEAIKQDLASEGKIVKFPEDIHRSNKANNKMQEAWYKKKISSTIGEFINNGTYGGKELFSSKGEQLDERKGKYIICAVVKSAEGKNDYLAVEAGDFFKEDLGSNLYYHMASDIVEHLIIRNPFYPQGTDVRVDVATRHTGLFEKELEDYKNLGTSKHEKMDDSKKKYQYVLMNADIFRTILTEQLLNERKGKIKIDKGSFKVRSITYYPKRAEAQAFLYLADSVCSYLTFRIGPDDINEVIKRANELVDGENLIFAYDEIDLFFKRAWQDMEVKEYYDALKELYNIEISSTEIANIYKNKWVKYLKDEIINETRNQVMAGQEPHALLEAITELRSMFMTNMLNPAEAYYIFDVLEKASKCIENKERYAKLLYSIYDVGVVANCHKGNFKKAGAYFEKAEKFAYAVDIEEYIRTRNRYTNSLLDAFAYEDALKVVRDTLELTGGLYNLSKTVLGSRKKNHFGKLEFAKTLSQAGQAAAYLGNAEALEFFNDALKLMKDNVANRKITESYRLHYLADAGNKEEFMLAMADYNDGFDSIKNQIESMKISACREDVNISFALFIFLKGIYKYCSNEEISKIWNTIKEVVDSVDDSRKNSHPWQLIFKYMGLLAVRMGEEEIAEEYRKNINRACGEEPESIVRAIALMSESVVLEAMGKDEMASKRYIGLFNMMEKDFPLFNPEKIECKGVEDKKHYLQKKFSYMYS